LKPSKPCFKDGKNFHLSGGPFIKFIDRESRFKEKRLKI
jgi:hypothetical protein